MRLGQRIRNWTGYQYIWSFRGPWLRTNTHKHPGLSRLMCYLGRHDFAFVTVLAQRAGVRQLCVMKCFYCDQSIQTNYDVED